MRKTFFTASLGKALKYDIFVYIMGKFMPGEYNLGFLILGGF